MSEVSDLREEIKQLTEDYSDMYDSYMGLQEEVKLLRANSANALSTPTFQELLGYGLPDEDGDPT